jgi:hypothetical protein
VPAPAVIPAPRAYINAVAVKGFVVELWVCWMVDHVLLTTRQGAHATIPRTTETSTTGTLSSDSRTMPAEERPCSLL